MIWKNFWRFIQIWSWNFDWKLFRAILAKIIKTVAFEVGRIIETYVFSCFANFSLILQSKNRLFGVQNDQRKRFYLMVLFESQSKKLPYIAGGTPWNYPNTNWFPRTDLFERTDLIQQVFWEQWSCWAGLLRELIWFRSPSERTDPIQ